MKQNGMEEGASSMFLCKRPGSEDTYLFFKALDRFTSDPRPAGGRRARLATLTCDLSVPAASLPAHLPAGTTYTLGVIL